MNSIVTVVWFISPVITGFSLEQHISYENARLSVPDTSSSQSDYTHSHFDTKPASYTSFGHRNFSPMSISKTHGAYSEGHTSFTNMKTTRSIPYVFTPSPEYLKVKYATPGKTSSDVMFYDTSNVPYNDEDDVRSSGRTMYDNYWPSVYHTHYDYEMHKAITDADYEKNKRYKKDPSLKVIPVHEPIENDTPNSPASINDKPVESVGDNPISGHEPFFSFVLNDYFDQKHDEDPLVFKGLDWAKDFDSYKPSDESYYTRSNRHLPTNTYSPVAKWLPSTPDSFHTDYKGYSDFSSSTYYTSTPSYRTLKYDEIPVHKSSKESDHRKSKAFDDYKKHETSNSNQNSDYNIGDHKYNGFKDIYDSFANKFGSENHDKKSNYVLSTNKDNGEKKKGFKRTYHINEFLEDNEFYDNSNSSSRGEEKGSSKANIGGSEAFLRSQAAAAVNNVGHTANKSGNTNNKNSESIIKGHENSSVFENKLDKYVDVAQQAAKSNGNEYT